MSTSFKKRETQEVSRRSRVVTGKKGEKKGMRVKNCFFCQSKPIAFFFAALFAVTVIVA